MSFQRKLVIVGAVCTVVILGICAAGCGSIELAGAQQDDGAAGAAAGSGGASGGDANVSEMPKFMAGSGGAGAGGGTGGDAGGTAGGAPTCEADSCNTCVNGKLVPLPDGRIPCGVCQGGKLMPDPDGTACGDVACSGKQDVQGFPGGGYVWSSSDAHVCKAGACTVQTTDCSGIVCPADCTVQYRGCTPSVSGSCVCVSTGGSVCQ